MFKKILNYNLTQIIVSIPIGLLAVYAAHNFLIVDICLDSGSSINEAGVCTDKNYHEQHMIVSDTLLVVYFSLGLIVSLISAFILDKLLGVNCASN